MRNVYTVADLMTAAARALQERDTDELFELMRVVRDWLQPEQERNAQMELLETMADVCEQLRCDEQHMEEEFED